MTERQRSPLYPRRGIAEKTNEVKSPEILKDGMTEKSPKVLRGGTITINPSVLARGGVRERGKGTAWVCETPVPV